MKVAPFVFVVLLASQSLAAAPASAPAARGRMHLTFTERSPHSIFKVMMRRAAFKKLGDPDKQPEYNLAEESFEAFVPANYKPDSPYGILVFISAGEGQIPEAWQGVLTRHKLIAISANNSGNGRDARYRMALALDAVHNLSKLYAIDEKRVYISGFSGGATAAEWLITGYPQVFRGGLFLMGGLFFYEFHSRGEQILPTVLRAHWDGDIDDLKRDLRLVFVIGENDTYSPPQTRVTYETLVLDGFERVTLIAVPRLGHAYPDAQWFEKGIAALDEPKPHKVPTTGPTNNPHPAPGQVAQAQRILNTADYYVKWKDATKARRYAQRVLDEYPTTPSAKAARETLKTLEEPTTEPAK